MLGESTLHVDKANMSLLKYHNVLGWHHIPGQRGIYETSESRTFVNINSKGLRDKEYPYKRIPGEKRVLVLGDSFTYGLGVNQQEIFTEVLENQLKDTEVINAGVMGYSTDQELLWFKEEGVKYKPDLVILVVCGNDIPMNNLDFVYRKYYKPRFTIDTEGNIQARNIPVPKVSGIRKLVFKLRQYSVLVHFLVNNSKLIRQKLAAFHQKQQSLIANEPRNNPFRLTIALIEEIRKISADQNSKFMIVANNKYWSNELSSPYSAFITDLNQRKFYTLDIEACGGYNDKEMQMSDSRDEHWNKIGHQFVAKEILNFLYKKQLLGESDKRENLNNSMAYHNSDSV